MKYDVDSINKRKKYVSTVMKILAIIFVILIYNIILIFISSESHGIGLFGYRAYIITSDSMEPSINNGDVIIIKQVRGLFNKLKAILNAEFQYCPVHFLYPSLQLNAYRFC